MVYQVLPKTTTIQQYWLYVCTWSTCRDQRLQFPTEKKHQSCSVQVRVLRVARSYSKMTTIPKTILTPNGLQITSIDQRILCHWENWSSKAAPAKMTPIQQYWLYYVTGYNQRAGSLPILGKQKLQAVSEVHVVFTADEVTILLQLPTTISLRALVILHHHIINTAYPYNTALCFINHFCTVFSFWISRNVVEKSSHNLDPFSWDQGIIVQHICVELWKPPFTELYSCICEQHNEEFVMMRKREGGRKGEVEELLPLSRKLIADFRQYDIPIHITATDWRPNIVLWSDSEKQLILHSWTDGLILDILWSSSREEGDNCQDLVSREERASYATTLITLEMGSRRVPHLPGFTRLAQELAISWHKLSNLFNANRAAIITLFQILCARSWTDP